MQSSQKWFSRKTKLQKIPIYIIGVVVALILLLIMAFIALLIIADIRDNTNKNRQEKAYVAAVEKCGTKPVVLVLTEGSGGIYEYTAYLPQSTEYNNYKTAFNNYFDFLVSDEVKGYYCTLDEAKQAYDLMPYAHNGALEIDPSAN